MQPLIQGRAKRPPNKYGNRKNKGNLRQFFGAQQSAESAIVTLSDKSGETIYSLVAHPITGRVRTYTEEVKPPGGTQTDDEGNQVGAPAR